jgi:hypothetical protein
MEHLANTKQLALKCALELYRINENKAADVEKLVADAKIIEDYAFVLELEANQIGDMLDAMEDRMTQVRALAMKPASNALEV